MIFKAIINIYRCERCGHTWLSKKKKDMLDDTYFPRVCPKCYASDWNYSVHTSYYKKKLKEFSDKLILSPEEIELLKQHKRTKYIKRIKNENK